MFAASIRVKTSLISTPVDEVEEEVEEEEVEVVLFNSPSVVFSLLSVLSAVGGGSVALSLACKDIRFTRYPVGQVAVSVSVSRRRRTVVWNKQE